MGKVEDKIKKRNKVISIEIRGLSLENIKKIEVYGGEK